jgi:acyl carrier protein
MNQHPEAIRNQIRAKVMELAAKLGNDASGLKDDDIIPVTGLLDSTALLELVVWYENEYDLPLKQEEINIDNLGSVNAMTNYLIARKSVR